MTVQLLTARSVADLLGVSAETVLRWTRRGDLPALKLPSGQVRYRQDKLEAWLADRATPGRGVRTTATDAAHAGRYSAGDQEPLPRSTDAQPDRLGVASVVRTTAPPMAAPEHEES